MTMIGRWVTDELSAKLLERIDDAQIEELTA